MADTTTVMTNYFRFLGMNIKGTPAMSAASVAHDLAVAKANASVLVTQEFRWPWYWRTASTLFARGEIKDRWRTSPGLIKGARNPVRGAQAVMWRNRRWKKERTYVVLLHSGHAGISEDRFLRAVLLRDRKTGLHCWFMTTHFVVGGDMRSDSQTRRTIMANDIARLEGFLSRLVASGHPVIGQLDGNLRPASAAYPAFKAIFRRFPSVRFHGDHGVEWLFTIDGRTTQIEVKNDWIIPTSKVRTDHEGRGITARLVSKEAA